MALAEIASIWRARSLAQRGGRNAVNPKFPNPVNVVKIKIVIFAQSSLFVRVGTTRKANAVANAAKLPNRAPCVLPLNVRRRSRYPDSVGSTVTRRFPFLHDRKDPSRSSFPCARNVSRMSSTSRFQSSSESGPPCGAVNCQLPLIARSQKRPVSRRHTWIHQAAAEF